MIGLRLPPLPTKFSVSEKACLRQLASHQGVHQPRCYHAARHVANGGNMAKVVLINPSMSTAGYSFITPRWLFVIAQSTPVDLVGDPLLVDESIWKFDPDVVDPGDIVGIGISSGNCIPGYRAVRAAKSKGATVIVGGIHATIFPEEPLRMGADAVVTGSGEAVWGKAVRDALEHRLQRQYVGGQISG